MKLMLTGTPVKTLKSYIYLLFTFCLVILHAQSTEWPAVTSEMKPGCRWWWLGSAVDQQNLTQNLEAYASAGMGSLEITPVYGVQNNDARNISFLSSDWMKMLKHTMQETNRLEMNTDMNTGTGWPFGGPEITEELAASKLIIKKWQFDGGKQFQENIIPDDKSQKNALLLRLMAFNGSKVMDLTPKVTSNHQINWKAPAGKWEIIAAFNGKTFQKVKRAAPGGEGYVMDHFSHQAVNTYFSKFEKAFQNSGTPWPHHFFNDSYEVYGADWTADFFEQFKKRRGYKLENYLREFLADNRSDSTARLIADYRETISDLLLENFTQQWTEFAHKNGSKTRNQAHGSPGNLIDLYASVDVPECEGFGLSDFKIPGLRKDSLTRKNDSDLSMLKYASSAAHISGKPYTSSETFTWLTEHFRTSLSQCKPDLDLMFVSGVNHMNFHGTTYSPKEAIWPGWLFYASVNMSPSNTIWRDAPALFQYITRCQSFLQSGKPDNDFLLYLPVYDAWYEQSGRFLQFSIHDMEKKMPEFIHTVHAIYENGFDVDYISERFILNTRVVDGKLLTEGGVSYKALILPAVKILPLKVINHLKKLAEQGATIVILDRLPGHVPGFYQHKSGDKQLKSILKKMKLSDIQDETQIVLLGKGKIILSKNYKDALMKTSVQAEEMITRFGLHAIRRSNPDGYHYFISGLQEKAVDGWIKLAVPAQSALIFDPVSGAIGKAKVRQQNGIAEVWLQIKPGASLILKTFSHQTVQSPEWNYINQITEKLKINDWKLSFKSSVPEVKDTFNLSKPDYWTNLNMPQLNILAGTGVYSSSFELNLKENSLYMLQLSDVRESARIFINEKEVTTLWAVPFECVIDKFLKNGKNTISIEVTNLPANRIADYDRKGVNWRIFNEINMVNIQYKKSDYSRWSVVESGLSGSVIISMFN